MLWGLIKYRPFKQILFRCFAFKEGKLHRGAVTRIGRVRAKTEDGRRRVRVRIALPTNRTSTISVLKYRKGPGWETDEAGYTGQITLFLEELCAGISPDFPYPA